MQERRRLKRKELIYFLRAYDRRNEQFLGHVGNISPQGFMLVTDKPIEPDTSFQLRVDLPYNIRGEKRLDFAAISKWSKRNGHSQRFDSGFELKGIAPNTQEIVREISLVPSFTGRDAHIAKRIFDVVFSLFGLFLLLPVFLLTGIGIRLSSPGPVLFTAQRVGKFGRFFRMYKFRTMNEYRGRSGPRVTAHDDPRITRIGRFLRQTKLNELPQLFNVLKGDMSFVGPRPEDPEFVAHYNPEEREVLSVKPGITSLASVLYASEEKMLSYSDVTETYLRRILPEKLRFDLLYIRNRSLFLDLDILFQTMLVLIPLFRRATPHVENIVTGPLHLARRHLSWFVIDAGIAFFSIILAGALWRSAGPIDVGITLSLLAAFLMTAVFSTMNWLTGVQRIQWRHASPGEAIGVIGSASGALVLVLLANLLVPPPRFPAQMLIVTGIFALSGFLLARYRRRLIQSLPSRIEGMRSATTAARERVLIVGSGESGQLTILLLRNSRAGRAFQVVGIVDDDLTLLGTLLHRVPVLGVCDRIPELVRENNIGTIVFAIHGIDESRRHYLLQRCRETSARTVLVPDLLTVLQRSASDEDTLAVPRHNIADSQPTTSFEAASADLRHQIRVLVEQARGGDTASVVRGLGNLEKTLEEAKHSRSVTISGQAESRSRRGDRITPAN